MDPRAGLGWARWRRSGLIAVAAAGLMRTAMARMEMKERRKRRLLPGAYIFVASHAGPSGAVGARDGGAGSAAAASRSGSRRKDTLPSHQRMVAALTTLLRERAVGCTSTS